MAKVRKKTTKKTAKRKLTAKDVAPNGISHYLKWFRKKRDYSQLALAKLINVNRSYIAHVENGFYIAPLDLSRDLYKIADHEEKKYLMDCLQREIEYQVQRV